MKSKPKLIVGVLIAAVVCGVAVFAVNLMKGVLALKTGGMVDTWSSEDGTTTPSQFMYAIFPAEKCSGNIYRLVLVNQSEIISDQSYYNVHGVDGDEFQYDKSCFTFDLPVDSDLYINAYMDILELWGRDTDIQGVSINVDQYGIYTLELATDLGTREFYSYSLESSVPIPLAWKSFRPGR